jgi:PqqD family protein of HPr-rel-A system
MTLYARIDGALVEPAGHLWAAYSPATGETALLNDESAAILEILEAGPASTLQVCAQLSADSGMHIDALTPVVEASWSNLLDAGLVRAGRMTEPAKIAG